MLKHERSVHTCDTQRTPIITFFKLDSFSNHIFSSKFPSPPIIAPSFTVVMDPANIVCCKSPYPYGKIWNNNTAVHRLVASWGKNNKLWKYTNNSGNPRIIALDLRLQKSEQHASFTHSITDLAIFSFGENIIAVWIMFITNILSCPQKAAFLSCTEVIGRCSGWKVGIHPSVGLLQQRPGFISCRVLGACVVWGC